MARREAEAQEIAWELLLKLQPNEQPPAWFMRNALTYSIELGNGVWRVEIYLCKDRKLLPGESWGKAPDGTKQVLWVNPETGEQLVVIGYECDDNDRVVLF